MNIRNGTFKGDRVSYIPGPYIAILKDCEVVNAVLLEHITDKGSICCGHGSRWPTSRQPVICIVPTRLPVPDMAIATVPRTLVLDPRSSTVFSPSSSNVAHLGFTTRAMAGSSVILDRLCLGYFLEVSSPISIQIESLE